MPPKCKVTLLLTTALMFLLTLSTTSFADELLSIKAGYQLLSPEGSIAGTDNGVGQKIDVRRDLDLDDSGGLTGEVALQLGNSRLAFNYLPISFSGTGTLKVSGTFKGQSFSVNDRVESELDIALYDIGYTYFLLNLDDLPIRLQLGLELAVKIADAEVMLRNLTNVFEEKESALVPIPTVGVRGRVALADFLGLVGRVGYMEYDNNQFLDAEAQVEFSPLPTLGLYAGYRYFDLKVDESDLFLETEFSGPFGGLFVRF
ncbi:hypothetical protein [Pelovirga terrestris]|uniref:TIGR04219 family outer membrane beta-barrel protein n=1 Tax=Pelovirga terrestris TaxID=2771352 RepID=A0A8J6QPE8_9BACT|nr:hypothetical protein [Pelovirga terrestris]MBD1400316.1 hypothetical protein [Pelovirga terrestris]